MTQKGGGRRDRKHRWTIYRTIGAAALPYPKKTKEKEEQGKGTADHLMPLGYLFRLKLESSIV